MEPQPTFRPFARMNSHQVYDASITIADVFERAFAHDHPTSQLHIVPLEDRSAPPAEGVPGDVA